MSRKIVTMLEFVQYVKAKIKEDCDEGFRDGMD